MWFSGLFLDSVSHSWGVPMMKITDLSILCKWEKSAVYKILICPTVIAYIFVLIFIFNIEPTGWADNRFIICIYDENRLCVIFHVQHHSASIGHYIITMLGLDKKI